ncbi:MAG: glycosyltransferase [Lachnospiraceae bacterium]|nr:glycosyltransferase [Lachnospiraceae bacterium]
MDIQKSFSQGLMKKMKNMIDIIFKPCYSQTNSYLQEIVNALEKNKVNIINKNQQEKILEKLIIFIKFIFSSNKRIVHCNWVENITRNKTVKSRFIAKILLLKADILHILGIKICWTMHNSMPHDCTDIVFAEHFINRWLLRVDMVVVHSRDSMNLLVNKYRYNENKILFVPHGAYKINSINQSKKNELVHKYEIHTGDIVFLYFGVISKYKNIPLLLETFSGLQDTNMKLILAGKIDGSIESQMQYKIRLQCSQLTNVILDERFIPEEEISTIFSLCDIVILPYDKTSMQNSGAMIQAFSNGKPVIIPEFGYVLDIKEKDFVFSYDYNSPKSEKRELMIQINNAVNRKDELKSLGILAKEFADTELNWNLIGKKIVQAYKNIK